MSTVYNVYMKLAYENTDFTRDLKFSEVNSSVVSGIKNAIQEYNANITETEKNILISDDYDATQNIGKLSRISEAHIEEITETIINLGVGGN